MHNRIQSNNRNLYIIITLLVLVLVGTFGYMGYGKYQDSKEAKENALIQQGILIGQESAVIELLKQTSTCVPVPVRYENTTLNLFALECDNLEQVTEITLQNR